MKFGNQRKNKQTPTKYEQDYYIREIKRFIWLSIFADQSLQCRCMGEIKRFLGITKIVICDISR